MSIFDVITMLGGLAMFLYGMEIMGDGLKQSSGGALKKVLGKLTHNTFLGLLTGTLVTAIIQSSTATIVLAVGLITAGILNLKQAVSIVLGANIGTTITAQIIRLMDIESSGNLLEFFKPSTLAPIALIIGIILIMFIKRRGTKSTGEICIGFGILFVGLMSMTSAVSGLSESQAFIDLLSKFSEIPILGILTGLVVTVIVQSSSATVGMLQAISSTGIMDFNLVYPIIMGINIGTCVVTAFYCSLGSNKDAKRTGLVHILFNCAGTILFMILMTILYRAGAFPQLWHKIVDSGDIANFQTLFNLITAIALLPFTNFLVRLSLHVIRPEKDTDSEKYPELFNLNDNLLISPAMALAEASKSVAAMGRAASENLVLACGQFDNYRTDTSEQINRREDRIDRFADTADNFLIKLSRDIEGGEQSKQLNLLMQAVPNIERIGDYATNFNELAERLVNDKLCFSGGAKDELTLLIQAVEEIIKLTTNALEDDDNRLARRIEPLEEVIDDMVMLMKNRHTERLRSGNCAIQTGLIFTEVLTYLERAADQCSSIAMLMMARENDAIMKNHHEYLRELHSGNGEDYRQEFKRQQEKYIVPLEAIVL